MTRDKDKSDQDEARTRQAKGSIQEAIGKIIGDPAIEQRGSQESEAGARQAKVDDASKAAKGSKAGTPKADKQIDTPIDRHGKD
ncbi:hypothetical protein C8J25_105251 [Sphingomonas faeni]|uniref:CsbD-like protein n=1 Tax=Sphingomonas faeni TaxID=185950 RepID=A0A2T5U4S5_9SPHN|nr:hypothetical protein [Sphingomonas faeni]PTW46470.1 hypothetical protein C8J25_105251 [Sphingomonas faeni]